MKIIPWEHYKQHIKDYVYLSELERFINTVILYEKPCQIILFGSLAKETYHWDSDIDLFVLFDSPCTFKDMKRHLLNYHRDTSNRLDVFPYNVKDFKELAQNPDLFIHRSLKDCVVIYDMHVKDSYEKKLKE